MTLPGIWSKVGVETWRRSEILNLLMDYKITEKVQVQIILVEI